MTERAPASVAIPHPVREDVVRWEDYYRLIAAAVLDPERYGPLIQRLASEDPKVAVVLAHSGRGGDGSPPAQLYEAWVVGEPVIPLVLETLAALGDGAARRTLLRAAQDLVKRHPPVAAFPPRDVQILKSLVSLAETHGDRRAAETLDRLCVLETSSVAVLGHLGTFYRRAYILLGMATRRPNDEAIVQVGVLAARGLQCMEDLAARRLEKDGHKDGILGGLMAGGWGPAMALARSVVAEDPSRGPALVAAMAPRCYDSAVLDSVGEWAVDAVDQRCIELTRRGDSAAANRLIKVVFDDVLRMCVKLLRSRGIHAEDDHRTLAHIVVLELYKMLARLDYVIEGWRAFAPGCVRRQSRRYLHLFFRDKRLFVSLVGKEDQEGRGLHDLNRAHDAQELAHARRIVEERLADDLTQAEWAIYERYIHKHQLISEIATDLGYKASRVRVSLSASVQQIREIQMGDLLDILPDFTAMLTHDLQATHPELHRTLLVLKEQRWGLRATNKALGGGRQLQRVREQRERIFYQAASCLLRAYLTSPTLTARESLQVRLSDTLAAALMAWEAGGWATYFEVTSGAQEPRVVDSFRDLLRRLFALTWARIERRRREILGRDAAYHAEVEDRQTREGPHVPQGGKLIRGFPPRPRDVDLGLCADLDLAPGSEGSSEGNDPLDDE